MKSLYDNDTSFRGTSVLISSTIADRLPACGAMWWYARALDCKGQGWVQISILDAAKVLNREVALIRRYMREGLQSGLFYYSEKLSKGIYKVFYKSLPKVAVQYDVSNLGAIAEVLLVDLARVRLAATEYHTEFVQRQSRRQAKKRLQARCKEGERQPRMSAVSDIFKRPSSVNLSGGTHGVLGISSRLVLVDQTFTPFGGSQKTIADQLKRSDRTIRRRLSNRYRKQLNQQVRKHNQEIIKFNQDQNGAKRPLRFGVSMIRKRQLAQKVELHKKNWPQLSEIAFIEGDRVAGEQFGRLMNLKSGVFRSGCNIYDIAGVLFPKRGWRKRVKLTRTSQKNKGHE